MAVVAFRRPYPLGPPPDRLLGSKLQIVATLDPEWLRYLEQLVDWKLKELKSRP